MGGFIEKTLNLVRSLRARRRYELHGEEDPAETD